MLFFLTIVYWFFCFLCCWCKSKKRKPT